MLWMSKTRPRSSGYVLLLITKTTQNVGNVWFRWSKEGGNGLEKGVKNMDYYKKTTQEWDLYCEGQLTEFVRRDSFEWKISVQG